VTALLELLITDGPNPCVAPDFDDEVVAASCVTRETAPAGDPTTPGVS
jgi:H+-translocating NAD(P) transhydrogenase subunit alpha